MPRLGGSNAINTPKRTPVTSVADMTVINGMYELTIDDGAAAAGDYTVSLTGIPRMEGGGAGVTHTRVDVGGQDVDIVGSSAAASANTAAIAAVQTEINEATYVVQPDSADEAARLALTPSDGWVARQIDTKTAWKYDQGAWHEIGVYEVSAAGVPPLRTDIRDVATSVDTETVSEKGIRTALDALSGDFVGLSDTPNDLTGLAARILAVNAAEDGIEAIEFPIAPDNLKSGPGAPAASVGSDGHYYLQLDAALGTNDIWGPKAGGAWPAQADFKSADPEVTTPTQAVSTTGTDYTTPRVWATEQVDQWGISRRRRRVFNAPASFDFNALGYPDKTAVFIRNTDPVNGITVTYGVGGAVTRNLTKADGSTEVVAGEDEFRIQPGEISVVEKDGNDLFVSIFPGERVVYFENYAAASAVTGGASDRVTFDGIAVIRDTGEIFGRKTTANSVSFPAGGVENADWFKVGSTNDDWVLVADTDPFPEGKVSYQLLTTDTGVEPALTAGKWFAFVRPDATGKQIATYKFHDGTAVRTIESAPSATNWQYSTDGMDAVSGDKIIVAPNHTINLTDVTDLAAIEFAPSTGNWADISAGTGGFNPSGAWTFGAGQKLPFGSDVLRAISNLGTTNWLLFTGGEDVPSQDERVDTVANLPLATTVNSGSVRVIYNDPTAANNRPWVAFGAAGATAIGWQ